ncbi:putative MFS multidrug transporter [Aureobasidium pullulans]|nr:putative MFS multidrug transporter [Aureobasidium pullulans]
MTKIEDKKGDSEHVEMMPDLEHTSTHIDTHHAILSQGHREYLVERHGTLDLDPMPQWGNADPMNWQYWKKLSNLLLVAISAMLATMNAAAIMPAFAIIAKDLDIPIPKAAYLTSVQIAVLGVAPLFWRPLSDRYGRRPIWLISSICSMIGNIGCAYAPNFGSMMACRALVSFFISPAAAIGSGVVTETFFKNERARYMGIWTLFVTCGVPGGAFLFGFVANSLDYRWVYRILAIVNGAQFIAFVFLGPETRYLRKGVEHQESDFKQQYMTFKRIDPTPMSAFDFIQPLTLVKHASIFISAAAYAMVFLVGGILPSIEIPQIYAEEFGFNAEQNGLQFIAVIIGSIIGEQMFGALSDIWMNRRARSLGRRPTPEYRLWLSHIGYALTIVGIVVFLVQLQSAGKQFNVTPTVGAGIAAVGVQAVTTVLITYAVDSHQEHAASIGVFVTFVRQTWGFIGPFWFPYMLDNVGMAGSSGVVIALIVSVSVIPTIFLQIRGHSRKT